MSPLTGYEKQKLFRQRHPGYYRDYNRERMRRKRQNNPEYVARERENAREYYYKHRDEQLKNSRRYHAEHRKQYTAHHRRYQRKHPELTASRNQAHYYVPLMDACEVCGSIHRLEHHHENYSEPLAVITVCKQCHVALGNKRITVLCGI